MVTLEWVAETRHLEERNLGRSGLKVSLIGLGCNNFAGRIDFETTKKVVHKALDLGITLFDNADTYGGNGAAEEYLGKIMGPRRKDIVLATKFGRPMDVSGKLQGASRHYILDACEASLKRLQTDYIDLYWQHIADPSTPIEETLRAMDDLVRQGKVRYIACSTLTAWQVVEARWTSKAQNLEPYIACQERYSLLEREYETNMAAMVKAYGLGLIPFSPLGNGLLTGKYRRNHPMPEGARLTVTQRMAERYLTERNWAIVERLAGFCEERGKTMLELAFSWLASRPGVASIIAGATRPEQLEQNVRAVAWALSQEEMDEIDQLTAN
jgi:aryl-alcohol dehydrogenase-like predicted oxidoreductase